MLSTLAVANYRSLRDLVLPLRQLNVVTGANGSGKSSVYRSLRLLAETAQGGLIASLAREGGLDSTLWAGPENHSRAMQRGEQPVQGTRRNEPVHLKLGFAGEDFGYSVELGLPVPVPGSVFGGDPEIKRECVWAGAVMRPAAALVDRRGPLVLVREGRGDWRNLQPAVATFDSMMTQCASADTPELLGLRETIRGWRFYDHFRTDAAAPARLPQIGTRTTVLGHDGADLAAALQTIREIGDEAGLDEAVDDAFPGARVEIRVEGGRFEVAMYQHGLLRPLSAAELSDGTLRYLLWIAALLTPRPPPLLVLNEPETSLHPDLLPALGRLIARAASHTQVIVVSHASRLIATLEGERDCNSLHLEKELGATGVQGMGRLERPAWHWPAR
ncbi:AAA family ATPase [Uliginosibacterium sp. H1]|uniref:AAA family ATPase n=1 Tax=Uliginosibacterium sp. H1 TaxID=3114757 RepID=UPI002E188DF5|nr:AAA family ATPase [Uliginosibacterium sp. H1]